MSNPDSMTTIVITFISNKEESDAEIEPMLK